MPVPRNVAVTELWRCGVIENWLYWNWSFPFAGKWTPLPGKDEEFATEKVYEGGGGDEHELGEEAGESKVPDQKGACEQPGYKAYCGDSSEDGEFDGLGVAARDKDEADVQAIGRKIGKGKGDQVVDDEVVLALAVGDRLAVND